MVNMMVEKSCGAVLLADRPKEVAHLVVEGCMTTQGILSVCSFALFALTIVTRIIVMKRRGILVFVMGQTNKSDYLLVPIILFLGYSTAASAIGLPMPDLMLRPFWESLIPGWFGIFLCIAANIGFAMTLFSFGDSLRMGIDVKSPGKLVTGGMFRFSRNPIYVCFLIFFSGLFLVHRNLVISIAVGLFAITIHTQILREEKFLASRYGEDYADYRKKVRRYL
jgi:protein-S-isoprenylcysteine O-methyltransferase Ste14